jgi:hypothetical protein
MEFILRHSTSSGEVDRLSLPYIDVYIRALTPWAHSSEATLQFVDNATVMFLCRVYTDTGVVREQSKVSPGAAGASFIYKMYSTRARTKPCGTLAAIFLDDEISPSTETLNFLLVKRDAISLTRLAQNCGSNNLYSRPLPTIFLLLHHLAIERTA